MKKEELKKRIVQELKSQVEDELNKITRAYESSHGLATDIEMKAESKWDTRSIEAGYLAGAQKKRIEELEGELKLLDDIVLKERTDEVLIGSLVEVRLNNQVRSYFISSTSGGSLLNIQGEVILVISAFSPIGSEVIGLHQGDSFEIETPSGSREYEVCYIY